MTKAKPKVHANSKYTPERVDKILKAIAVGATFGHACSYAGIDHDTFNNWRKRYSEFSDAVKEAEGKSVVGWLAKIEKAASDGNWTAAAWKLERRFPEEYGRKEKHEHSGEGGGPITFRVVYEKTTNPVE